MTCPPCSHSRLPQIADFVTYNFIENAGSAWGSYRVEDQVMGHLCREIGHVINHMGMRDDPGTIQVCRAAAAKR